MTKYGGLMLVADRERELQKRAFLDNYAAWTARHPWLSFASGFVPGVGTATFGADALRAFSQGRILSGLGSTIGAVGSLAMPFLGAGLVKGVGRGLARVGVTGAEGAAARASGATTASLLKNVGATNLGNKAEAAGHVMGGWKPQVLGGTALSLAGGMLEGGDPAYAQAARARAPQYSPNPYGQMNPLASGVQPYYA